MSSVTQRIKEIVQPDHGYLPVSQFKYRQLEDGHTLSRTENIHPSIMGLVIDYLSRYMLTGNKLLAFSVPIEGAGIRQLIRKQEGKRRSRKEFPIKKLLTQISGLDDASIIATCQLVLYDASARVPDAACQPIDMTKVIPNEETIENIRIMVNRTLDFFSTYGPLIADGFTFEGVDSKVSGYTETVDCGDGDFLTKDTIWEMKTSRYDINQTHSLQLLMYYIMGKHSGLEIYKEITTLGVFNPRLNRIYRVKTSDILPQTIKAVEKDVICYVQKERR